MVSSADCESLFTKVKTRKMITGQYQVRHFLSFQQALEQGELDTLFWVPGVGNPADGVTRVRSDVVPLFRLV